MEGLEGSQGKNPGTLLNLSTCFLQGADLIVLKLSTALATAEVQTPADLPCRSSPPYAASSLQVRERKCGRS